jgi:hypothetical protein
MEMDTCGALPMVCECTSWTPAAPLDEGVLIAMSVDELLIGSVKFGELEGSQDLDDCLWKWRNDREVKMIWRKR